MTQRFYSFLRSDYAGNIPSPSLVHSVSYLRVLFLKNVLEDVPMSFYFLSIKPNRYPDKGRVSISRASKTNQTASQVPRSLKFKVAKLSVNVLELSSIGPRMKSLQLSTSSSSSEATTFQSDVWFSKHWFVFEPST